MTTAVFDETLGPTAPATTSLRLRVLEGRSRGGEHRLVSGRAVRVGHGFDNDIVLRGTETKAMAFELHVDSDGVVLKTITGTVEVLGRQLAAGDTIALPRYLPVRFGDFSFAVGDDEPERWSEAAAQAERALRPVEERAVQPQTDLLERASLRLDPVRGAIPGWLTQTRTLLIAFMLAAAIAVGLLVGRMILFPAPDAQGLKTTLTQAGFTRVSVRRDDTAGVLVVSGTVQRDADAERLRALVAQYAPGTLTELDVTEAMAQAASDLLVQQKVEATVRAVRAGVIEVSSGYLPADRQVELTAALKRDLPGLSTVQFRVTPGTGDSQLRYFFNSPDYGAASFVSGDPGYIVTADGSRWFPGATLPTGHRIITIVGNAVTLERAGRTETLIM